MRKKLFVWTGAGFAAAALVLFLVGGYMSGWDIAGWFSTPTAYILYFLVAFYAVFAVSLFVLDWLRKK